MSEAMDERAALAEVARFLKGLSANDLDDIRDGRVKLGLIPVEEKASQSRVSDYDGSSLIERLRSSQTRGEAESLLNEENLKVADLRSVMSQLDVVPAGAATKAKLIEQIVRATVGSRLQSEAVRGVARD